MKEHIVATYVVHDPKKNFKKKAEQIAIGMTVGTWTELPQAQKEQMQKYVGKVVEVQELEAGEDGIPKAIIKLAYPEINFSHDIPALLTSVFGKISMDGKIKLVDVEFSPTFLNSFGGPAFGIQGIRDTIQVQDRPLLMSIFKSCIGQDLNSMREQFYQQALGGVDLIKDDEILFDNELTPFEQRIQAALEAAEEAAQHTGQKTLYAVNLTGPVTQLIDKAKRAVELGANALLLNVLPYGFDILHRLSMESEVAVPIMAHPALAGALYPSPHHGIAAPLLLGKLMRIAGADLVLFPSPYGSVAMDRTETLHIARNLREHLQSEQGSLRPCFPVPSAGIHPGITPLLFEDFGLESVMNAGGGIHGHPQGAGAGGRAFRQAIDILTSGQDVESAYQSYPELKQAIDTWGLTKRESN